MITTSFTKRFGLRHPFMLAPRIEGACRSRMAKILADRIVIGGAVAGGLVATVILLGMCGMRIRFA